MPLRTGELVCAVHPGNQFAGRDEVEPRDLAPHPLISFSRLLPLGELVDRSFHHAGVPRRIALEVNQSSVAVALVRAGVGVAVVDFFVLAGRRDHGVVRLRLRPRTAVGAEAPVPRDTPLSRPALMLLAALRRSAVAPGVLLQHPDDPLLGEPAFPCRPPPGDGL